MRNPPIPRQNLLNIATDLVERLGYNPFSYRDLADATNLTTASIHCHFPTKGDLGLTLLEQQRQQEAEFRKRLDSEHSNAWDRIAGFAKGFQDILDKGHRMCLCGMISNFDRRSSLNNVSHHALAGRNKLRQGS